MLEINTNFQKQRLEKPSRNQTNETSRKKTVSQISEGLSGVVTMYHLPFIQMIKPKR